MELEQIEDNRSNHEIFTTLSYDDQMKFINALTDDEAEQLRYDWKWWGRPNQQIPDIPFTYLIFLAGRGWGKTRTLVEAAKKFNKQGYNNVNFIGATKDDAIDILIKGESGILNSCDKWERPTYKNEELHWPNGAVSLIFSADAPERLRGKQSAKLLVDELGAWRYAEAWDMAVMGLRLGNNPQAIIATTPRPTKLLKDLIKDPNTVVVKGTTYDNKSNLAPTFLNAIVTKYEGTRLGRQELNAEMLEKNENALWSIEQLDELRVPEVDSDGNMIHYEFRRIIVAVDPAVTSNENSDMTGIVVAGLGTDGFYYIIKDLTMIGKPSEWATVAINAYYDYKADKIVAEVNNGGDMVEATLRNIDKNISFKKVTASRGKILRAEPIASLYEQKKVFHIGTNKKFEQLEKQMCEYDGLTNSGSPDRLDAMVWAMTELSTVKGGGLLDMAHAHIKAKEDKKKEEDLKKIQSFLSKA